MAWIELHQSLWTHRKTITLAALLDIDEIYAAAHMSKFWTWALDNAQDGDISSMPNRVIAFGAGWKGDANEFVDAIRNAGWVTKDGYIHDWFDYAGRLIEKKNANKTRMREKRAANVQRTNDEQPQHVQGLPNLTIPNHTKPKIKEKNLFSDYTSNDKLVKTLESFVENRKKIKKPMTDRAVSLLLGELDKLASSDEEKIAILEQSIFNGWQGVFALKDKGVVNGAANRRNSENPNSGINFGF